MRALAVLLLTAIAFAVAGCGGDGESEAEREADNSGRGTVTCSGTEMMAQTGLPDDFPTIDGVVYVKTSEAGPSHVVDGYAERDVKDLYDDYKSAFEDAGYTILFDEIEHDDAEVSYKTKDETSEGQVALRECEGDEKTSVHVTNRPE